MNMTSTTSAAQLPKTLTEIRNAAAATLANKFVHSVNILAAFGEVTVFKNGTVKFRKDCPELN